MEISKLTNPEDWVYFANGNANILYKYVGNNDYLTGKLLRLRLIKPNFDYISTCELYDFIELKCKHLFPDLIIDIQLVVLTKTFIQNLKLPKLSQINPADLTLMTNERYGLLIPNILDNCQSRYELSRNSNLYYNDDFSSVTIELKPKWLYDNKQNYCRTCLLNQHKGLKRHFCPLDFLYPESLETGIQDFLGVAPVELLSQMKNSLPVDKLLKIFLSNPNNVFQKLKKYQKINDKNDLIENLSSADDVSTNLSLVMTLRDVGLFLKFEKYDKFNNIHNSHNNVNNLIDVDESKYLLTCNIYDLDLKSKSKYKHWLDIENKLKPIYDSSNPSWRFCIKHE